ncbi:MAG: hypothetical protein AAF108_03305 [Planctomycetota bacterium]
MSKSCYHWLAAALSSTAVLAGANATAQESKTILRVNVRPFSEIEPAEKDRALYDAVSMLGTRLAELPMELDSDEEAGPIIDMAWRSLFGGTSLHVATTPAFPGVGLAAAFAPMEPLTSGTMLGMIGTLLQEEGAPAQIGDGEIMMPTPAGPLVAQNADGQVRVNFNLPDPAPTEVQRFGLPAAAATPIISGSVDLQTVSGLIEPMLAAQDPMIAEQFRSSGLIGPNAPTFQVAVGTTPTHLHSWQRVTNARAYLAANGLAVGENFTADDLRLVPRDATKLVSVAIDLGSAIAKMTDQFEATGQPNPFAMAQQVTGIDLQADVLSNIGPKIMFYQSDTTGGGGLLSGIVVAELRDAETFAAAHARSVELVNSLAGEEANGYVRVRAWKLDGRDAFSLTFPGLPIPLELSWTVFQDRFVAAASPGGLSAALAQIDRPTGSIMENATFQEAIGSMLPVDGAASVFFSDTARFAAAGYELTGLVLSGLANAVRSPIDADRQVGVLMPSYNDFVRGIKPSGGVMVLTGDEAITTWRGDASMIVQASEFVGTVGGVGGLAGAALGAGIVLPGLGKARESARQLKSATQLRGISQAMVLWSIDHDDVGPANLDQLLEAGLLPEDFLISPLGPASDGGPDILIMPNYVMSFNAGEIIAVDRAMWVNGHDGLNVAFGDSHVEFVERRELISLLDEAQNQSFRDLMFGKQNPVDW